VSNPLIDESPDVPESPRTLDGRYLVVRGRLWRASNPALDPALRQELVDTLMAARRAVRDAAGDPVRTRAARQAVDEAKQRLGERGPVWWTDGAPDYNRHLVKNSPYAAWFAGLASGSTGHADDKRRSRKK
jgi:hypothetical protein